MKRIADIIISTKGLEKMLGRKPSEDEMQIFMEGYKQALHAFNQIKIPPSILMPIRNTD